MLMTGLVARAASLRQWVAGSGHEGAHASPAPAAPRTAWLDSHPGEVSGRDVERALRTCGLSAPDVRLVTDAARSLGLRPFTMWMFLATYGARELAVAVTAGMSHDRMLDCLSDGTLPPFEQLQVFAALRGLQAATDDDSVPAGAPERPLPGWDSFFDDLVV